MEVLWEPAPPTGTCICEDQSLHVCCLQVSHSGASLRGEGTLSRLPQLLNATLAYPLAAQPTPTFESARGLAMTPPGSLPRNQRKAGLGWGWGELKTTRK